MGKPVVLVTGASSGIGKVTAQLFAQNDYIVFGTSRHSHDDVIGVTMLILDVTSDVSVNTCVNKVIELAGRIDVLVNNAGIVQMGAVEELAHDELMPVFETNYFGVIRMTQAVLPHMRAQGSGHIISIGSLAGRLSPPAMSAYAATKAALVALCGSLRAELAPFGVKVSVVEPGAQKSNIGTRTRSPIYTMSIYNDMRERIQRGARAASQRAQQPNAVANKVLKIAQSNHPGFCFLVGRDARILSTLKWILPERFFERGLRRRLGV